MGRSEIGPLAVLPQHPFTPNAFTIDSEYVRVCQPCVRNRDGRHLILLLLRNLLRADLRYCNLAVTSHDGVRGEEDGTKQRLKKPWGQSWQAALTL